MIFSSGHFGGFDGDKIDDVIEMCVTSKQESGRHLNVKMTFPCVYSRAVVVNDKIWIIGGMTSTRERS